MAGMHPTHSCYAPHAWPQERGSAGAHALDRQDRGDDDGDDYNDKRIMVDYGLLRYTGLTAKQRGQAFGHAHGGVSRYVFGAPWPRHVALAAWAPATMRGSGPLL